MNHIKLNLRILTPLYIILQLTKTIVITELFIKIYLKTIAKYKQIYHQMQLLSIKLQILPIIHLIIKL